MINSTKQTRRNESGNALFLILIAVALFAALSYAVTQSGRGSGTIDREQSMISSSQITQYPAAVRTAVTRMVITGTAVNSLHFDDLAGGVFASDGGGAIVQAPPANIGGATAWEYKTAPSTNTGWFIGGIGTDIATGKDVFAYLDNVSQVVCSQILRGLSLNATPLVEATAVTLTGTNPGLANQTGGGSNTDVGGAASAFSFHIWQGQTPTNPQAFACVKNGAAGNYLYYHALVEQ